MGGSALAAPPPRAPACTLMLPLLPPLSLAAEEVGSELASYCTSRMSCVCGGDGGGEREPSWCTAPGRMGVVRRVVLLNHPNAHTPNVSGGAGGARNGSEKLALR